jgi:acetylornithine deacetylase
MTPVLPLDLLRSLVAIDTTSSRPNAPFIDHLAGLLGPRGFAIERLTYTDEKGVQKQNLIARAGPPGPGGLALVGHTDCVPFDPAWTEALTLLVSGDFAYARGACDTKGFIACALHAALHADLSALKQPLTLVFTADEEIGCVGAKKLVDAGTLKPTHAIVGEPTSLRPVRAHKGYCLAEIELLGAEGHSAYPDVGASAIRAAGRFLASLDGLDAALKLQVDPDFTPPYTTTNVGVISGGKAKNIIAGRCAMTLEWRPIPTQPTDIVEDQLKVLLAAAVADPKLAFKLEVNRHDRGVSTPADAPIVQFLSRASGNGPATVSFGTEAPQLTQLGAQACVFGPGDISNAHKTGEFVPLHELTRCAAILADAIRAFTG